MCRHKPVDDKYTGQTYCMKCGKLLLLCKRVNGKPILESIGGSYGDV
jgi:hypothetical protein